MAELGRTFGAYRLCGLLGRGSVGSVYRAENLESGSVVALKTVKVPWAAVLPMVRREILALGRLRHPGVVRILDSGAESAIPWYAMELIHGPSLREWSAERRAGAMPDLLTLFHAICGALAYVHGQGIVHRDLKPENILIRTTEPVLVDFGVVAELADDLGRERLEVETGALGTPLYMAPEQIRGALVDARADLYALGCVMYEILAGRPPFSGSALEVGEGHLHREPPPLQDLASDVPTGLAELVHRLLRKDRRERLGYATDVAVWLEGLGAAAGSSGGPEAKAYLYRPELIGREVPLAELEAHVGGLESGRGETVLIRGESGVGKTRLLLELARRTAARPARWLAGECLPEPGRALEALRKPLRALADWCRQQGVEETRRVLAQHGKLLGRFEPSLSELDGLKDAPEPVVLPPEAARQRLFLALEDVLRAFAADRGLVLALDDLQWADELTLGFVEHMLAPLERGSVRTRPILIIGTIRTEETGLVLRRLLARGQSRHLLLDRLRDTALASMVQDMLALGEPAPVFERFLARQTEGNPLFAGEYLRTAVAEGILYRDAQGRWQVSEPGDEQATEAVFEALPLPGALRALLERRLGGLDPGARKLAEAVAVLGREVDEEILGWIANRGAGKQLEATQELLARGLMEQTTAGRLRFSHDKLREVTYANLTSRRRRSLHRAAAEAVEALYGTESVEHQAVLGHHWERGGKNERAGTCYLAAARLAVKRDAHAEGERCYRACLALPGPLTSKTILTRIEFSDRLLFHGRTVEATAEGERALGDARRVGDVRAEAESLRVLATVCRLKGQIDEARIHIKRAYSLAKEMGDRSGEMSHSISLANIDYNASRLREAIELYRHALDIARDLGDRRREAIILANLANTLSSNGEPEGIESLYDEALRIHRDRGDRVSEGVVLTNMGVSYESLGRFEEASRMQAQALSMHRASGNRWYEAVALACLGKLHRALGRVPEARASLSQARTVCRETGNPRFEAQALVLDVGVERLTGSLQEAKRLQADFRGLVGQIEDVQIHISGLCEEGYQVLADGESAGPWVKEGLRRLEEVGAKDRAAIRGEVLRLQRAQEAFEAGQPLFRGECWEEIPQGLRNWIEEQRATANDGERRERSDAARAERNPKE